MFCRKCGARITDETTRFCPSCGEPFTAFRKKGPTLVEKIFWAVALLAVIAALFYLLSDNRPRPKAERDDTNVRMPVPKQETPTQPAQREQQEPTPRAPAVAQTVSPRIVTADSLNRDISESLKDFRYSLDIKYLRTEQQYRVTAVLSEDGQRPGEYLDGFARFFAACYGNADYSLEVASISVKNANGTDRMSMGIGSRVARSLPISTWQHFSGLGSQLAAWVKENARTNPPSPEDACYYQKSDNF